jgi:hypothetical protein
MKVTSWLSSVLLLVLISGAPTGQSRYSNKTFAATKLSFQDRRDFKRKGMEITFSYNDVGKLSKIIIKSNQLEPRASFQM